MPLHGVRLAEEALKAIFGETKLTSRDLELIGERAEAIFKNFKEESKRVADFEFDIHWRSRVINIPALITHFKELWLHIEVFIHTRGDLFTQPFADFKLAVSSIGSLPREPGESRIVAGFAEVEAFIQAIDKLITDVQNVLETLGQFQDMFDTILSDIEHLDGVFLPQNSQRNKTTETYFKRSKLRNSVNPG